MVVYGVLPATMGWYVGKFAMARTKRIGLGICWGGERSIIIDRYHGLIECIPVAGPGITPSSGVCTKVNIERWEWR